MARLRSACASQPFLLLIAPFGLVQFCRITGISRRKKTKRPLTLSVVSGLFIGIWWSWGDLNPRPQAFFGQIYMFSGLI